MRELCELLSTHPTMTVQFVANVGKYIGLILGAVLGAVLGNVLGVGARVGGRVGASVGLVVGAAISGIVLGGSIGAIIGAIMTIPWGIHGKYILRGVVCGLLGGLEGGLLSSVAGTGAFTIAIGELIGLERDLHYVILVSVLLVGSILYYVVQRRPGLVAATIVSVVGVTVIDSVAWPHQLPPHTVSVAVLCVIGGLLHNYWLGLHQLGILRSLIVSQYFVRGSPLSHPDTLFLEAVLGSLFGVLSWILSKCVHIGVSGILGTVIGVLCKLHHLGVEVGAMIAVLPGIYKVGSSYTM